MNNVITLDLLPFDVLNIINDMVKKDYIIDRRLERIVAAAAGGNAQWLKIKFNLKSLTNEINNGLIFQCDCLFEF